MHAQRAPDRVRVALVELVAQLSLYRLVLLVCGGRLLVGGMAADIAVIGLQGAAEKVARDLVCL